MLLVAVEYLPIAPSPTAAGFTGLFPDTAPTAMMVDEEGSLSVLSRLGLTRADVESSEGFVR